MAEEQKPQTNAAASDVDIGIITEKFKIDSKKTLVWNGLKLLAKKIL